MAGPVAVDEGFLGRVKEIVASNTVEARALWEKVSRLYADAFKIIEDAVLGWVDRATEDEVLKVFKVEGEGDVKEEAKRMFRELLWCDMRDVAETLAEKDDRVRQALEEFQEAYRKAEELRRETDRIVARIMPVDDGSTLTKENLVELMVLVYKICRELEKKGLTP